MARAATRRRGGGRAGNAARRGDAVIEQMPWRIPVNTDRPTEPLSEEGIAAIHEGAMRILEEIGIEILNAEALEIFRQRKRGRGAAAASPGRPLGEDPATGKPVVVKSGRYGPYVTDGETNASLGKGDRLEEVTPERAYELLAIRREAIIAKGGPTKKRAAKKKAAPRRKTAAKPAAPKTTEN